VAEQLEVLEGDDDPVSSALDPANVLPRRIDGWARAEPDRPFLTEPSSGRTATYGELWRLTRQWATVLSEAGVHPGCRVATLVPSSIDAHAVWLAISLLDAFEVPVNPELRGDFLRHQLSDAKITHAVTRPELAPVIDGSGVEGIEVLVAARDGSSVADATPWSPATLPGPDDVACVIYTSGTTGPSKGVVIGWAQMTANLGRIPRRWLSADDAVYSPWPMFHVTGRSPMVAMSDVGGRVVLRERFSLADFWTDIRDHGCTSTTIGAVVPLLLAEPERDDDADNPLRFVLFGGVGNRGRQFMRRFDCAGLAFYGSTEVGFPIAARPVADDELDVAGRLRKGYEARVTDTVGDAVAPGEVGELWIRPPDRRLILREYLDQPARTADVVVDGWYRTGDAVRQRGDGSFVFVDRMNHTIRRFGENISSTALETVVAEDADVMECAAVGVPSEVTGHDVLLVVMPRPGRRLDPAALAARLDDVLPRYMRPSFIAVVDDLPRTPTRKIRKAGLLDSIDFEQVWRAPRS
jgi:crotonobetaine/carnitine-CoA ligase